MSDKDKILDDHCVTKDYEPGKPNGKCWGMDITNALDADIIAKTSNVSVRITLTLRINQEFTFQLFQHLLKTVNTKRNDN